jgi:hypothetical protein
MILTSATADVIHRFIKLIAADVSGLVVERSIQSTSQTFCAQTPVISDVRPYGIHRCP